MLLSSVPTLLCGSLFSFHKRLVTFKFKEIINSKKSWEKYGQIQFWQGHLLNVHCRYEVCPESIHPCTMKKRDIYRRYKTQEILYIGQWHLSPLQSRHHRTSRSSPSVSSTVHNTLQNLLLESPSAAPSYFPKCHPWSEISSLSKVILVLGKARSRRVPNLGRGRAESPWW